MQELEIRRMEVEIRKEELEVQKKREENMFHALIALAKKD